jgi:hypothetical protein
MDLPSRRVNFARKMKQNLPLCFSIFLSHRTNRVVNSLCPLLKGK